MKIYDVMQGTEEWQSLRCGIPTASNFEKIVTIKGERSKQSEKYMYKLAGEVLSGIKQDNYQSQAMIIAIETEEEARDYYELINDVDVEQVGFCLDEEIGCGASPDGIVGDGLLEIKCPLVTTHIEYFLDGKLPTTYIQQVQGQLMVTGKSYCDFMSYFPNIKPLIVRVERDEEFIEKLKIEIIQFNKELKDLIERIKK